VQSCQRFCSERFYAPSHIFLSSKNILKLGCKTFFLLLSQAQVNEFTLEFTSFNCNSLNWLHLLTLNTNHLCCFLPWDLKTGFLMWPFRHKPFTVTLFTTTLFDADLFHHKLIKSTLLFRCNIFSFDMLHCMHVCVFSEKAGFYNLICVGYTFCVDSLQ